MSAPRRRSNSSPERVAGWMAEDPAPQVIDVREPHEREAGYIDGTRHIELTALTAQADTLERDRPVVFYCRVGRTLGDGRAGVPCRRLRGILDEPAACALGARGAAAGPEGGAWPSTSDERGDQMEARAIPESTAATAMRSAISRTSATGPAFARSARALGVTAFGVNAIVLPPGDRDRAFTTTTTRRSCTSSTAARSRWSSATAPAAAGRGRPGARGRGDGAQDPQRRRRGRRVPVRRRQGRLHRPRRARAARARSSAVACGRTSSGGSPRPEATWPLSPGRSGRCASTRGWRSRSGGDAAHEPLLRSRRPARQRHRLACGGGLRRRASRSLSEAQRERLLAAPGARVVAVAQDERSQARNRELALERLAERLAAGLRTPRARRATRPTAASRKRRLEAKRHAAQRKSARRPPRSDEDG